jgi:hypothetical protein
LNDSENPNKKKINMRKITILVLLAIAFQSQAQSDRWQQSAKYTMEVEIDVEKHQFSGNQTLVYDNNSPDTLRRVFYHLYLNAFQPGSMMDVRSRSLPDPDRRVKDRISKLKMDEIGYQKVNSLTQNGKSVKYEVVGTILEVMLPEPIMPNSSATFQMDFEGQVPKQIRRSGWMNAEGVEYSMTQWYPKMSEYDYEGWHSNPYIAREFHGVWSDFDVKITMDSKYTIGGTGYLQNAAEIGHGYDKPNKKMKKPKADKLTWHFVAPKVHDFAFAADPDYIHDQMQVPNGPMLHFFYQNDTLTDRWEQLQPKMVKAFQIMGEKFGQYPYKQYSIIQGGDGGMEYSMCTLITGHRSLNSLVGVSMHEAAHSWFQGLLATNESKYSWMDEGFTSYADNYAADILYNKNALNPHAGAYRGYFSIVGTDREEPLTVHSDHYRTNRGYGLNAYSKGAITLNQLNYVIGDEAFGRGMLDYFNTWKYKHPNPNDFKRIMERASDLELDWYFENWVGTTKTIDYGIKSVVGNGNQTTVMLERVGEMPMPVDVIVTYKDSTRENFYIPMRIMRGEKPQEFFGIKQFTQSDWPWVYPEYSFRIPKSLDNILSIEIDPTTRMADVDRSNNVYPSSAGLRFMGKGVEK